MEQTPEERSKYLMEKARQMGLPSEPRYWGLIDYIDRMEDRINSLESEIENVASHFEKHVERQSRNRRYT